MNHWIHTIYSCIFTFFIAMNACPAQCNHLLDINSLGGNALQEDGSLSKIGVVHLLRKDGLIPDSFFELDGVTPKANAIFVTVADLPIYDEPPYNGRSYGKLFHLSLNTSFLKLRNNAKNERNCNRNRPCWVVKYFSIAGDEEIERLRILQESVIAHLPMEDSGFPIISLSENDYSYEYMGKRHSLVILHAAQGKSIEEYFTDLLAVVPNLNLGDFGAQDKEKLASRAFNKAGISIAKIHLRFAVNGYHGLNFQFSKDMRTLIHGDYHAGNLFYHAENDRVYFIDNETMVQSIQNPLPFARDIEVFIENLCDRENEENKNFVSHLYEEFVNGYLSCFPLYLHEQVRAELNWIVRNTRGVVKA